MELSSQGYTQSEIADILKAGIGTVNRDLKSARRELYRKKEELGDLIYEEHHRTLYAFNQILKQLWKTLENPAISNNEKMKAISLLLDAYHRRIELLDSTPIIGEMKSLIDGYKNRIRKMEKMGIPNKPSEAELQELWDAVEGPENSKP